MDVMRALRAVGRFANNWQKKSRDRNRGPSQGGNAQKEEQSLNSDALQHVRAGHVAMHNMTVLSSNFKKNRQKIDEVFRLIAIAEMVQRETSRRLGRTAVR